MAGTRMPYGRTGLWFARVPCWISALAEGRILRLDLVARDSGRSISIGVRRTSSSNGIAAFEALSRMYDGRGSPELRGIDEPDGEHAVVLYGVLLGKNAGGADVMDLSVRGGAIIVEPADEP